MWNGASFEKVTLLSISLRIQLGHPKTNICPFPARSHDSDFTIIDCNGIQKVHLDYCGCQQSIPKYIQLLRARLFPSTTTDPHTAATFNVLNTFQMLNFTSKISAYEFYTSLARRTDSTGTVDLPVSVSRFILTTYNNYLGPIPCLSPHGVRMETHTAVKEDGARSFAVWSSRNQ